MPGEARLHSMSPHERALALEVLADAWAAVAAADGPLLQAVRTVAATLPLGHPEVSPDYADHVGQAAEWYLDRAVRRLGDPDRDGHTARQRQQNLDWFASVSGPPDIERLFAVACALNADDV
jgi:hypothetical protein